MTGLYDNFLTQHVTSPTRKNVILDVIIRDEPDMIHKIADLGALESSDHHALLWRTRVQTETAMGIRRVFDYPNADISGMKLELQAID